MRAIAAFLAISMVLLGGCGARGSGATQPASGRTAKAPSRYHPGDPDCRAHSRAGTIGTIDEDVIGAPVGPFVSCYGLPWARRVHNGHRCLYYRDRGSRTYWRLCVRAGAIVSAAGDLPAPG
jgi:hypothetical protein